MWRETYSYISEWKQEIHLVKCERNSRYKHCTKRNRTGIRDRIHIHCECNRPLFCLKALTDSVEYEELLFSRLLPVASRFKPQNVILTSPLHRDANEVLMNSVTFVWLPFSPTLWKFSNALQALELRIDQILHIGAFLCVIWPPIELQIYCKT